MKQIIIIAFCFIPSLFLLGQDNAPTLFEPEQFKEDIDFLLKSLDSIHPTFHQRYSDPVFRAKTDSIKQSIHHPMSKLDFFKTMQPLIAVDGHTSLRYDGAIDPEIEAPLFPFKIVIHDNHVYIKENLTSNRNIKRGMIIESVNGLPASEIIGRLSTVIPHDRSKFRLNKTADEFHMFYRLIYGSSKAFNLVMNDHGIRREFSVPGAKWEDFNTENKPQFDFKILEQDIAYLHIRKFRKNTEIFMTTIDSVFSVLKEKNINHLIIDDRSGGGVTSLADSLISYLTDKPFKTVEKKAVKISPANTDYIHENKSGGTVQDGYLIMEYPPVEPVQRNNRFQGRVFVLINNRTYSTAAYFASVMKCNGIGKLVGEEAGQPLISNGDLTRFRLPNTGLACYTSMSTYYFPCAENGEDSVKPNFEVPLSIEEILNEKDQVLEFVLALIQKDKNTL